MKYLAHEQMRRLSTAEAIAAARDELDAFERTGEPAHLWNASRLCSWAAGPQAAAASTTNGTRGATQ